MLTVRLPAEEMRKRIPAYWGSIRARDTETCEFRTGGDDLRWLAVRVAMLGVECEVHEPAELVEELRALAARLRQAVPQTASECLVFNCAEQTRKRDGLSSML